MSHDPYDNSVTYNLGFQGIMAPDFIRYKNDDGEWRCLYRTENIKEFGEKLYPNQEGTLYHNTSSGTHCFTQLTGECDLVLADNKKWLVSDSGQAVSTNCFDDDHVGEDDITTSIDMPIETDQRLRITRDQ
jgi:hypothetical protein